jgi:hypothetical protein
MTALEASGWLTDAVWLRADRNDFGTSAQKLQQSAGRLLRQIEDLLEIANVAVVRIRHLAQRLSWSKIQQQAHFVPEFCRRKCQRSVPVLPIHHQHPVKALEVL